MSTVSRETLIRKQDFLMTEKQMKYSALAFPCLQHDKICRTFFYPCGKVVARRRKGTSKLDKETPKWPSIPLEAL